MLAQRRLTEAQLWKKLETRGYEHEEIAEAVSSCKANGYIDDRLYASLYVEGARKAVGDARLCADLVKRGVDREAALTILADAEVGEEGRIEAAYLKNPADRTAACLSVDRAETRAARISVEPDLPDAAEARGR